MKKALSVLLAVVCLMALVSCGDVDSTGLWADAIYAEDTQLGDGAKALTVEVTAGEKTVVFTVMTDAETVGAALSEAGLLEGEQGAYGLYVKKVNGITADFDQDQTYWAFYLGGEYATAGVDTTAIEEGVTYQLVRTK